MIRLAGEPAPPPAELARLLVRRHTEPEELRDFDLDGDGKFTSADLLLHTLAKTGAWKPGTPRPGRPVPSARTVRPGGVIRIAPPSTDRAVLIFGVSHTTYRLERARGISRAGDSDKDEAWAFVIPEDVPATDHPTGCTLWLLHDRMLSAPTAISLQCGPTLRSATLDHDGIPGRLVLEVENLFGSPHVLTVMIGKDEWSARRLDDDSWIAEGVEVTSKRASARVRDDGGRSNSALVNRRVRSSSGDAA